MTIGAAFLSVFSVISLIVVREPQVRFLDEDTETDLTFQINVIHLHSYIGDCTHIPVLFGLLIVSNLVQSIGTILNIRWMVLSRASSGTLCSLQGASIPTSHKSAAQPILSDSFTDTFHLILGGIKQAGNIGTTVW